jgi:hypothetical protein
MKRYFFVFLLLPVTMLAQTGVKNIVTDKMPGSSCDHVVHKDLLVGAENRTPSECEVEFDWKIRTALRNAFSNALKNFPGKDWVIADTAVNVLKEIGRQTEKYFFNLSYDFKIDLNPSSELYRSWSEKYQAASGSAKFMDFYYSMNNAIHIRFYVRVNTVSDAIYFIKGGQQNISVPGAAYAVKGPYAAALTGGGDENALDAALIIFGKPKVVVQKEDNGGMSARTETVFPKGASRLTVQQVSIRIECNDALLSEILKNIDFRSIAAMMGH